MLHVLVVLPAGTWSTAHDWASLDFDQRRRRRRSITTMGGMTVLLDLPAVVTLRDGDGLALADGRVIGILAAPEALLEIACREPRQLARIAWHLGNRHLPTEITGTVIRIRADHVIADMARGLGAELREVFLPFNPEGGAYGGNGHAQAGHHHPHDHDHHDHA